MTTQSNSKMPLLTLEGKTQFIAWNEREVEITDRETKKKHIVYEYDSCRTELGADYATIVSAIVRSRYSQADVEAIILNYGDGDPEHEQRYAELQAWRVEAKTVARQVLGIE